MSKFVSKISDSGKMTASILALIVLLGFIVFMVTKPKFLNKEDSSQNAGSEIALEKIGAADLMSLIQNSQAPVKMVNMWATWCGPCVAEFPALMQARQEFADDGMELYLVSMDMLEEEAKVRQFLGEHKVDFTSYLKNEGDHEFIDGVNPDWSGALPATFLFNREGGLIKFWTGDKSLEEFREELRLALKTTVKETEKEKTP